MTAGATFSVLLDGYTDLPPGKIANVVTFLERTERPTTRPGPHAELAVRVVDRPALPWFRDLYRRIGERWLWFSAVVAPDDRLRAYLSSPTVAILVVSRDGVDIGLAQLDFSVPEEVEIVTFGVVEEAIGTGAAAHLMDHALAHGFRAGVTRVWLHTCSFDHPRAVGFYLKSGFRAWKFAIEVSDDPRASGALPETAGPHVPFLKPRP